MRVLLQAVGGMSDLFDGLLSEFFGHGPIPPESVARKVLGIGLSLPLNRPGIKAAFRFRVKLLRPDLPEAAADALRRDDLKGDSATQLAELLWARDDLLRRVKDPVTGSNVGSANAFTRNEPRACKGCHDERRTSKGEPYGRHFHPHRWAGYCWPCASDQENARQRELRRQRRANRPCDGCGERFTGSRSDARYCRPACRQRAYRRRAVVA
jgi:hypothetical protein